MPNINLIGTITTSTTGKSYLVVSDKGTVKRWKIEDFYTELQGTIPDAGRTDQNLFTASNVTFQSISLYDKAAYNPILEDYHGFQANSYHFDGTNIKSRDYFGTLRFGGFDGNNNTLLDNGLSVAGLSAVATEDWKFNGTTTTNAGSAVYLHYQPSNTQLSTSSRVVFLSVNSTATNTSSQETTIIRIGSGIFGYQDPYSQNTSSDGQRTYTSPGRSDVVFLSSRIQQFGVPQEDTSPANNTLLGTNSYTFTTGRRLSYAGTRLPIRSGDTIGQIAFRGVSDSNQLGDLTALIRVHATTDYASGNHGAGLHIRTSSTDPNSPLITSLDLQPEANTHSSDVHMFRDRNGDGPALTITTGTIIFNDASVQSTAYPGITTVPASSTSSGIAGQIASDSSYVYVCVAPNQWKRIAAEDF